VTRADNRLTTVSSVTDRFGSPVTRMDHGPRDNAHTKTRMSEAMRDILSAAGAENVLQIDRSDGPAGGRRLSSERE
jgi:hypothetical protein